MHTRARTPEDAHCSMRIHQINRSQFCRRSLCHKIVPSFYKRAYTKKRKMSTTFKNSCTKHLTGLHDYGILILDLRNEYPRGETRMTKIEAMGKALELVSQAIKTL